MKRKSVHIVCVKGCMSGILVRLGWMKSTQKRCWAWVPVHTEACRVLLWCRGQVPCSRRSHRGLQSAVTCREQVPCSWRDLGKDTGTSDSAEVSIGRWSSEKNTDSAQNRCRSIYTSLVWEVRMSSASLQAGQSWAHDENRAPGELECAGPLLYTRVSVLQRAPVMHVRYCDDSVLLDRDWSQPSFWDLAPRVLLLLMISVQIEGVLWIGGRWGDRGPLSGGHGWAGDELRKLTSRV